MNDLKENFVDQWEDIPEEFETREGKKGDFYRVYPVEKKGALAGVPYLETKPNHGGEGVGLKELNFDEMGAIIGKGENEKWVTVGDEFRKSSGCGKTAMKLEGVKTGSTFFKFIHCFRWFCEKCGSKGGRIHKKRLSRILQRVTKQIREISVIQTCRETIRIGDGTLDLRQFVFTVPMELRKYFMTREDITALNRFPERIVNDDFHGCPSLRYFHAFGDKSKGVYAPHVNIHVFEIFKKLLKIPIEQLQDIRKRYGLALKGYIYQVYKVKVPDEILNKIDIHYSYVEGDKIYERNIFNKDLNEYEKVQVEGHKLIIHRISYMSRPCPGYKDLDSIKGDPDMLALFVVGMKGFHYITNCGSWKMKDNDRKDEAREMEALAGESLRIARDSDGYMIFISKAEFLLTYAPKDYTELSDGFYRVNSS